ncbi:MAG: PorT family protein [Chitinivibrionia bacterium]|nr:PorT family protein [Chitinivibrionia bacterium]
MRKGLLSILTLATIFVLIASTSAFAQLTWEVGAKGGLSIADIMGDDVDSTGTTDMRLGFAGGAFVTANINKDFAVRLEALYVQKGAKGDFEDETITMKLDYIEVPILAVIKLPAAEKLEVQGFAGVSLAFKMSAKVSDGGEEDIDEYIKGMDYGLTVGAGLAYDLGTAKILFDGRWTYGLSSIDDTDTEWDVKNSDFLVMAGVGIPIPMGK